MRVAIFFGVWLVVSGLFIYISRNIPDLVMRYTHYPISFIWAFVIIFWALGGLVFALDAAKRFG